MPLGLPIPYIFVVDISDEDNDSRLEIIDGTQRIRTLAGLLNNDLKLQALKKLKKFNNFRFDDLSSPRQRRFKRTTIRMSPSYLFFYRSQLPSLLRNSPDFY
jgi:uncharacterized protein with ParB-like and HNH nuclease domain